MSDGLTTKGRCEHCGIDDDLTNFSYLRKTTVTTRLRMTLMPDLNGDSIPDLVPVEDSAETIKSKVKSARIRHDACGGEWDSYDWGVAW